MTLWYFLSVRAGGKPVTGLKPTFLLWRRLDTLADITPAPEVTEVGCGIYRYSYDALASGDAVGQVDALGGAIGGSTPTMADGDRWIDTYATREGGAILRWLSPMTLTIAP